MYLETRSVFQDVRFRKAEFNVNITVTLIFIAECVCRMHTIYTVSTASRSWEVFGDVSE